MALRWEDLGAPRLHVVDLDGAKSGASRNREVMADICRLVEVPVEVSGGIRTIEDIAAAFAYGAERVQLGSVAVRDRGLVGEALALYPGGIVIAIDAREGEVFIDGWTVATGVRAIDLARQMEEIGVPRIMFTDIGRDSTLTSPNFEALAEMVAAVRIPVVASGGVTSVDDLRKLAEIGCEGAIVGKALYEGTVELPDALRAVVSGG
jgi:phosphoribosylformimino-5-aminoimidazole carboxamide ribotide isomerase